MNSGIRPLSSRPADDFDDSGFDDFEDDFYDEDGNVSSGGLYDAGGHLIPERWADFADAVHDRMRDDN